MRRALAALCLSSLALCSTAHAQAADIPRTPEGRPDFSGTWESRWRTPLERQDGVDRPVVTAEEVAGVIAAMDARAAAVTGLHPDLDFDWGPLMPAAGGGFRTSLIVDPADGKLPLTPEAKALADKLKTARDAAENPEARNFSERCMRGPGHAPLTINPDNMNRMIVQTGDHLVIYTENSLDTRIIAMSGAPRPDAMLSWMGDSRGRWEGDTLVIETRLLRRDPASPSRAAGQRGRSVVERLAFNSPDELGYSYVLDDPAMYTAPVHAAFTLPRTSTRMFEVSCHEGNYSLANILLGARMAEQRAAAERKP